MPSLIAPRDPVKPFTWHARWDKFQRRDAVEIARAEVRRRQRALDAAMVDLERATEWLLTATAWRSNADVEEASVHV